MVSWGGEAHASGLAQRSLVSYPALLPLRGPPQQIARVRVIFIRGSPSYNTCPHSIETSDYPRYDPKNFLNLRDMMHERSLDSGDRKTFQGCRQVSFTRIMLF